MSIQGMLHLQSRTTNASCTDPAEGQGQGHYKVSFHVHSSARGPRKKIYHGHLEGKGPRKGEAAVVKVFRNSPGTETQCDLEIDKHRLAFDLATAFNEEVTDVRSRVAFTLPMKCRVDSLGLTSHLCRHKGRSMDRLEWVLVEENMAHRGEFNVFVGKSGQRFTKDPTSLDAFIHFSYHHSGGNFVMCGFQGVHTKKGYLLTTPSVHSQDNRFGQVVDKGTDGIAEVFSQHRCNNLCYDLLPAPHCSPQHKPCTPTHDPVCTAPKHTPPILPSFNKNNKNDSREEKNSIENDSRERVSHPDICNCKNPSPRPISLCHVSVCGSETESTNLQNNNISLENQTLFSNSESGNVKHSVSSRGEVIEDRDSINGSDDTFENVPKVGASEFSVVTREKSQDGDWSLVCGQPEIVDSQTSSSETLMLYVHGARETKLP